MPVAAQIGGGGSTRTHHGLRNPGIDPRLWLMISTFAQRLRLDPYAVAAVSRVEGGGRFGAVGDGGTSFGPFQLHVGGALPPGRNAAWANSAQGVLYAMQRMATVARGLTGLPAVRNIVYRFERPANPAAEVSSAWAGYRSFGAIPQSGGGGGGGGGLGGGGMAGFGQYKQLLAQQAAAQAKMSAQLAAQFKAAQQQMLDQMKTQAAQARQQSLAATIAQQAQQRVAAGRTAQQSLSAGGLPVAGANPTSDLFDQRKLRLDDVRALALRRAGLGV